MANMPIVSIIQFLPQPRLLELSEVERAAGKAYEGLFSPTQFRIAKIPDKPLFGVALPVMMLGVVVGNRPYFGDNTGKAADAMRDFGAKRAIQEHAGWIGVDLMQGPRPVPQDVALGMIGKLTAELIQPDVLGLMRRPDGRVTAYDARALMLLRNGKTKEAFELLPLVPVVRAKGDDAELAAATAEAMRRLPEFLEAFANRQPGHGFSIKKCFTDGNLREHIWIDITSIEGRTFSGTIGNEPQTVRTLSLGSSVSGTFDEIEDWIFTVGKRMVGGFQIAVLQKYGK